MMLVTVNQLLSNVIRMLLQSTLVVQFMINSLHAIITSNRSQVRLDRFYSSIYCSEIQDSEKENNFTQTASMMQISTSA
jgi:hypothetical protein